MCAATHFFGRPADVARVKRLCERKGVLVVEDAAQAMGGQSKEAPSGNAWGRRLFQRRTWKKYHVWHGRNNSDEVSRHRRADQGGAYTCAGRPLGEVVRNWLEMVMMRLFIHPSPVLDPGRPSLSSIGRDEVLHGIPDLSHGRSSCASASWMGIASAQGQSETNSPGRMAAC